MVPESRVTCWPTELQAKESTLAATKEVLKKTRMGVKGVEERARWEAEF